MKDQPNKLSPHEDSAPKQQVSEKAGTVEKEQVTKQQTRRKDLARGSEPDTRGASGPRH